MSRTASLRRLFALARPEAPLLAVGTVALLVSAGMGLLYPLLVQRLVDGVQSGADPAAGRAAVDRAALQLVGLFAVGSAFAALRAWLFTWAGERVVARLRERLYASVIGQEIAFFDERRTGELTSRLASDASVLQNAVTVNVSMLLRHAVLGIGAVTVLMWTSFRLASLMLATVPVVVIAAALYGRALRRLSRDVQDALARASEVAEETFSGIRTVRAFAREAWERGRYGEAIAATLRLARRRAGLVAAFTGGIGFAGQAAIAAVVWYGGVLLVEGRMTFGELTSFLLYTFTVAFSVGALAGLWEDFMKALGASERVFELLDREPRLPSGALRPSAAEGAVRFDAVSFAYPSRPDAPVLAGLDLELRPGEVVALVGPSGAGKSTVAALLSRFYDPGGGRVALDGRDLRELDPDWLRQQVGVVSQEPILFATTIAGNIRYGRPGATEDEVLAAARAAYAHDFVSAFPEGYATLVGERGVRLSGGQKQRVAIARALLKDPRVLVLDEATSALDAESEHLVQQALDRLMRGRTTLVIAHRLSTVRRADRVLVLDGGRLVQQGTHQQLLAEGGLYRVLVERQFAAA
ncbi:ATP-binding cassette domain-containing protein [Myxococcota bacterium]|nr:ATP-binding cassette domain-containing protein [Myxococcota bacterium]